MKRAMSFGEFVETLEQLEHTASSSLMGQILSRLFARLKLQDARPAAYLLQGKMAPDYAGIESAWPDKLVMRAIAASFKKPIEQIATDFRHLGDLGDVAAKYAAGRQSKKPHAPRRI